MFTGKLRKVDTNNIEAFAKEKLLELKGTEDLPRYYKNYAEWLRDETQDYIEKDGVLYEVIQKQGVDADDDIFEATQNPDGTIDFVVKYYNGGCGFYDAIGEALDSLNKLKGE